MKLSHLKKIYETEKKKSNDTLHPDLSPSCCPTQFFIYLEIYKLVPKINPHAD